MTVRFQGIPYNALDPDGLEGVFAQGMRGAEGGYQVPFYLRAEQARRARAEPIIESNAVANALAARQGQMEAENTRLGHMVSFANAQTPYGLDPYISAPIRAALGVGPGGDPLSNARAEANLPTLQRGLLSGIVQREGAAAENFEQAGIDAPSTGLAPGALRTTPLGVRTASVGASAAGRPSVSIQDMGTGGPPVTTYRAPDVDTARRMADQGQGITQQMRQAERQVRDSIGAEGGHVIRELQTVNGNGVMRVQRGNGTQEDVTITPDGRRIRGRIQLNTPSAQP